MITVLAVLAAGAAYLPIDPSAPAERTEAVLRSAAPPIRVTDTGITGRAGADPARVSGDNLAYVIHTSGSTGRPNGVQITRRALAGFVQAATRRYGITRDDRVLQFAAPHFDASVEEIFVTLCAGAALVVRTGEMTASIPGFLAACDRARITVLDLPTAFWHEMVPSVASGVGLPPALRTVIIGGEAALSGHVATWLAAAPGVRLINTYGPTEATVVATAADLGCHPSESLPL